MQEAIIGIQHIPGSFSDRWIEFCDAKAIPYRVVNALSTNLWHEVRLSFGIGHIWIIHHI